MLSKGSANKRTNNDSPFCLSTIKDNAKMEGGFILSILNLVGIIALRLDKHT